MNRSLCLVPLIALAIAPKTGQASDGRKTAVEQRFSQESAAAVTPWYIHLDSARREARRTGKPLMIVFR